MKRSILLFGCFILLNSCLNKENPENCGVENPEEDIAWIKEAIESSQSTGVAGYAYLIQGTYKGETVFIMASCCPFCYLISIVQNCKGETIPDASLNDVRDQKVIWRPEISACNLD